MNERCRKTDLIQDDIRGEVYDPNHYEEVKDDILDLARYARDSHILGPNKDVSEWIENNFTSQDPDTIRVLLNKGRKVIGFSLAYGVSKTLAELIPP